MNNMKNKDHMNYLEEIIIEKQTLEHKTNRESERERDRHNSKKITLIERSSLVELRYKNL